MAKSNNQKAKILYLEKMLRETGEHRVISMQKILENLEKQGIRAERKSIYDDVESDGFRRTLPNFKLLSISPELIWNTFPVIQAVASESGFMAVSLVPLNWMESFVSLSLDALAESPRIILPLSKVI